MAKKAVRGGVNKSAAVRDYLKDNPAVKPKEASAAISKQLGITITPAFVSQVKTLDKKNAGKKTGKRGRRASAPMASSNGSANGSVGSVAAAIKAGRELLAAAGSQAEALAVIKALAG